MTILLPKPQPSFTVVQPDRRPEQAWSDYWASLDAFVRGGAQSGNFRELLHADRTYYVGNASTTPPGNDSNDGLSAATPWLTFAHAFSVIQGKIDFGAFNVTLQLLNGTYTTSLAFGGGWVGAGSLTIRGDPTTPSNVIINVTGNQALICDGAPNGGFVFIRGLTLQTTDYGIFAASAGQYFIDNMIFGVCGNSHMLVGSTGVSILISGNYSIIGGAAAHIYVPTAGGVFGITTNGITVTLTGTPAFSTAFVTTIGPSQVLLPSSALTFSGGATGVRYNASANSVINTVGGGFNFFPGNAPGVFSTGGQYLP